MKIFYIPFLIFLFPVVMIAQMPGQSQRPVSFVIDEYIPPVTGVIELQAPDLDLIEVQDAQIEEETGRYNIGRKLETSISMANAGEWHYLSDGSRLWRAALRSDGAQAVNLYFSKYHLPEGAELYVYNDDKSFWDGPYTWAENNEHGLFLSEMVFGDQIIVEYYEPQGVIGEPKIEIDGLGFFYRGITNYLEDARGSDPCQVDVNCPEGNDWQAEKDAVVRLLITQGNQSFLCSGVLMNNTAWDCRQLMLTALHCVEGLNASDLGVLQVKFNFEVSGCNEGFGPSNRNRTGVLKLSDSNDGGGESGSDFALFEIEDEIFDDWNPYFAGWRRTSGTSSSGVSIHHPSGDHKKISTYDSNLSSVWWGAPGSHWEVYWTSTQTDHGTTEGGSSGSPIFDDEHYVIGTLTGGLSFCNSPNEPDYYGKMSYHWISNGTSEEERLAPFLDPEGTGDFQIPGTYRPCDPTSTEAAELTIPFSDVKIYPNPVSDQLKLEFSKDLNIEKVEVFNALGVLVDIWGVSEMQEILPVADYSPGIYYITFFEEDGRQLTRKFSKR